MWHNYVKFEHASVVAGFNSQNDSEEALLGLRMAGFDDGHIGYYYVSGKGQMRDHLANDHRFAASIIGGILGVGAGLLFARWSYPILQNIDPIGLALTSAVFGSLFLGTAGGLMGIWSAKKGSFAPVQINGTEPYVLAVDAGEAQGKARTILEQHGGHDLSSRSIAVPVVSV